jgi:excisionase family DNA binding protein
LGKRLPDEGEMRSANQLRQILAAQMSEDTDEINLQTLVDNKPTTIALHRSLSELLLEMLRVVGAGDAVTLVPVHQQLTTQQAADILNVSRPYLIKLLEQGVIDHHKVGRHRRVRACDVFEYKDKMATERVAALSELARTDADFI